MRGPWPCPGAGAIAPVSFAPHIQRLLWRISKRSGRAPPGPDHRRGSVTSHTPNDHGRRHRPIPGRRRSSGRFSSLDLSNRGDIVIDPFLGSGSTLIAADKTGRVCRGVELDPRPVEALYLRLSEPGAVEPTAGA